jgi:hypothetical protein
MITTPSSSQKFQWQWLVAGFMVNVSALFIVPAMNWTAHPVQTWLTLVLFPYGMLWTDWGSAWACDHLSMYPWIERLTLILHFDPRSRFLRYFFWFAPFVIYGLLLAKLTGRHWRTCCYALAVLHTIAAGIATMRFFRL